MSKRKYFSLEEKVKIITYAEENPQLGWKNMHSNIDETKGSHND